MGRARWFPATLSRWCARLGEHDNGCDGGRVGSGRRIEELGGGVGNGRIGGSPGVVKGFVNELAGTANKADAGGTGGAEAGGGGSGLGNGVMIPPIPCSTSDC